MGRWLYKKEKPEKNEKGPRCCFGDGIDLIPCRVSCFELGRFEEQDELHQDDLKKRINSLSKCKIASATRN